LTNGAATAAFLAGDFGKAHDLVDDARAYDAVLENEWQRLHAFIAARAAAASEAPGEPGQITPAAPARRPSGS
jgi:hypothetical protein